MFYICVFFPASISLLIENKINEFSNNKIIILLKYIMYTFLINMLANIVVFLRSSRQYFVFDEASFTYDFSVKYMIVGLIAAIILPYLNKIISSVTNINVLVKERDKNGKKHK